MKTTIRIKDMQPDRPVLAVDLCHVLSVLGQDALDSEWQVTGVWATGDAAEEFEGLSPEQRITGHRLCQLAGNVVQVVDGQFNAFRKGSAQPWVSILADDSTLYEVETDEGDVAQQIRQAFKDIEEGQQNQQVHRTQ